MDVRNLLTTAAFASRDTNNLLETTQGHILEKHRRSYVWNFLLRFRDASAAEALANLDIASVADLRAHAGDRKAGKSSQAPPMCFLGLSSHGCDVLHLDTQNLFVLPFSDGFRKRANRDLRLSDKAWDSWWKGDRYDGVLVCAGDCEDSLAQLQAKLQAQFGDRICVAWTDQCKVKTAAGTGRATEHFGFADGVSQPVFFPDDPGQRPAGWQSRFDPAAPLAAALIDDPLPGSPKGTYGSFMAYVDIEQHKAAFDAAVSQLASQVSAPNGMDPAEYAGALIIGRYKDGTPLIPDRRNENDFDRNDDPHGQEWPFASHISKMNPREGDATDRRLIVRRGVTYEKGERQGLIFQSFQASLTAQFETLLATWARSPHLPRADAGVDPLLTGGTDTRSCPKLGGISACMSGLTTIRGGEYFYFPSIPGIRALAGAGGPAL